MLFHRPIRSETRDLLYARFPVLSVHDAVFLRIPPGLSDALVCCDWTDRLPGIRLLEVISKPL